MTLRLRDMIRKSYWLLFLFLASGGCFLAGLRTLRAIFRTAATAAIDPEGVKGSANDVISHAGEILHTTTANEHDGVFLQIVAFAGNVGDDFLAVGQADLGDFAKRGVRLLRRAGHDLRADAAALRALHSAGDFDLTVTLLR